MLEDDPVQEPVSQSAQHAESTFQIGVSHAESRSPSSVESPTHVILDSSTNQTRGSTARVIRRDDSAFGFFSEVRRRLYELCLALRAAGGHPIPNTSKVTLGALYTLGCNAHDNDNPVSKQPEKKQDTGRLLPCRRHQRGEVDESINLVVNRQPRVSGLGQEQNEDGVQGREEKEKTMAGRTNAKGTDDTTQSRVGQMHHNGGRRLETDGMRQARQELGSGGAGEGRRDDGWERRNYSRNCTDGMMVGDDDRWVVKEFRRVGSGVKPLEVGCRVSADFAELLSMCCFCVFHHGNGGSGR